MSLGIKNSTCFACGRPDPGGEYVALYCSECQDRILKSHDGKMPGFFDEPDGREPRGDCPCPNCSRARSNQGIVRKLKESGAWDDLSEEAKAYLEPASDEGRG